MKKIIILMFLFLSSVSFSFDCRGDTHKDIEFLSTRCRAFLIKIKIAIEYENKDEMLAGIKEIEEQDKIIEHILLIHGNELPYESVDTMIGIKRANSDLKDILRKKLK